MIEPSLYGCNKYVYIVYESFFVFDVLKKLNISAKELLRTNEELYVSLNLKDENNEERLIEIMIRNPILIQRPIIIKDDKAVIARPIENLKELLNEF